MLTRTRKGKTRSKFFFRFFLLSFNKYIFKGTSFAKNYQKDLEQQMKSIVNYYYFLISKYMRVLLFIFLNCNFFDNFWCFTIEKPLVYFASAASHHFCIFFPSVKTINKLNWNISFYLTHTIFEWISYEAFLSIPFTSPQSRICPQMIRSKPNEIGWWENWPVKWLEMWWWEENVWRHQYMGYTTFFW